MTYTEKVPVRWCTRNTDGINVEGFKPIRGILTSMFHEGAGKTAIRKQLQEDITNHCIMMFVEGSLGPASDDRKAGHAMKLPPRLREEKLKGATLDASEFYCACMSMCRVHALGDMLVSEFNVGTVPR